MENCHWKHWIERPGLIKETEFHTQQTLRKWIKWTKTLYHMVLQFIYWDFYFVIVSIQLQLCSFYVHLIHFSQCHPDCIHKHNNQMESMTNDSLWFITGKTLYNIYILYQRSAIVITSQRLSHAEATYKPPELPKFTKLLIIVLASNDSDPNWKCSNWSYGTLSLDDKRGKNQFNRFTSMHINYNAKLLSISS